MAKNNVKETVLLDTGITTMEELMAVFGDLAKWEKLSQTIDNNTLGKIKDKLLRPEFYQGESNTCNPAHLPAIERIEWEWYESIYRNVCKINRKSGVLIICKREVSQKRKPYKMSLKIRVAESLLEVFFRGIESKGNWGNLPETDMFDKIGSKVYVLWRNAETNYNSNLYKTSIGYPFAQEKWLELIQKMIEQALRSEVLGQEKGV